MKTEQHDAIVLSSPDERTAQSRLAALLRDSPIPEDESLANLGLFLTSKTLSRILFFQEIYRRIVGTHGVIMEFGVRWGQTLSIMTALRGIHEPFNRHRKVIGFDTFAGFAGVTELDSRHSATREGSFSVSPGYADVLAEVLSLQEALNPIPHLRKFELVTGDVSATLPAYLEAHPETLISLAVLDLDIYKPTRDVLKAIRPHLFRGSVLVFDELCDDIFPGETVAVREVLGFERLRVERLPMTSRMSYVVLE